MATQIFDGLLAAESDFVEQLFAVLGVLVVGFLQQKLEFDFVFGDVGDQKSVGSAVLLDDLLSELELILDFFSVGLWELVLDCNRLQFFELPFDVVARRDYLLFVELVQNRMRLQ